MTDAGVPGDESTSEPLAVQVVDLNEPPTRRWRFPESRRAQGRRLAELYGAALPEAIERLARRRLPEAILGEIEGVAEALGISFAAALVGNLHFDLAPMRDACTAFAIATPEGPLHARNLDYRIEDPVLSEATMVTRFEHGPRGPFVTVGWPGFVGALSGVAPGRFALSLNTVSSGEAPAPQLPVVILLRRVLEEAASFDEAVAMVAETPIVRDCLLLVTGVESDDMVVVERTPSRHATRRGGEVLAATNGYLAFDDLRLPHFGERLEVDHRDQPELSNGARHLRIRQLLASGPPPGLDACLDRLATPGLLRLNTVHQAAFHASSGAWRVRVPSLEARREAVVMLAAEAHPLAGEGR